MSKGFKNFGAEFQVNTHEASIQSLPSVSYLKNGGYVVTWQSYLQDSHEFGIYGQRYNANGDTLGGEFQISSDLAYSQHYPSVTTLENGSFVVTWQSEHQDGSGMGIYGQRFTAGGTKAGGEFRINSTTLFDQSEPSVTALNNGGFVVTWQSYLQDAELNAIIGQRYNASGSKVGSEFQINTYETSTQIDASVAGLSNDGFVVTWVSFGQDGSASGVFAQRFKANGNTVGSEFQVNTHTASTQFHSNVTGLENGGFIVTWASLGQDAAGYSIYAQRYNNNGSKIGGEFRVNDTIAPSQTDPVVTGLADDGFLITWQSDGQDGSVNGVYSQRYDANGDAVGGETLINSTTYSSQWHPSVALLNNGGFIVSWGGLDQDASFSGVFAQQFAARLFGTSDGETMTDSIGANWINGQGGNDILKGFGGNDKVYGGFGNDSLYGGKGKDLLEGGKGNDNLFGSEGRDTLTGGDGKDVLNGGKGPDKMTGGKGADDFVFKNGYGKDRIMDFKDDVDTIMLGESLWGGGMSKQQVINTYASVDGGDIVFDFGSDELRLKGFTDLGELKDDMVFI